MQMYFAHIHFKLQYGTETYGQATTILLKQLQVKQNKALNIYLTKIITSQLSNYIKNLNYY